MVHRAWIFAIAFITLFLDQLSKYFVELYQPSVSIFPFFSIQYVTNTGAAFGIFQDMTWLLIVITVVVLCIFLYYFNAIPNNAWYIIPAGLFLGGALGNLVDRIFRGHVIDFLVLPYWPAFNVADMALTSAVIIYGFAVLILKK
ncbi:MAG: signal peptidase II [Candidatus Woesearchaeota archaeon]